MSFPTRTRIGNANILNLKLLNVQYSELRTLVKWVTLALTITCASCAGPMVVDPIPCPPRPELQAIATELQLKTPPEVLVIVASNQIKLKQHIKLLETYCEQD